MSLEDRMPYIERCPRCSQCKWAPIPKSQRFAPICPSVEYGNFHSYSASGKGFTAYALAEGRIGYSQELLRSVYACTMCGACDTACKTNQGDNVEPLDTLYELRAHLVEHGQALPAHKKLIANLVAEGNPMGRPRAERGRFAAGLAVKNAAEEAVDVLLYVGSAASYDETQWASLRFVARAIERAGVSFGVLGAAEVDSGGLAYDIGFRAEALRLAQTVMGLVANSKARIVVSFCAEAYAAFKNIYPRLGISLGEVRVIHVSEYLIDLIRQGAIRSPMADGRVVTYHDPCKLGRLSECYEPWNGTWRTVLNVMHIADPPCHARFGTDGNYAAPRELLGMVRGLRLVEMERAREFSYCCGAAGGAKEAFPEFAEKTARDRLAEAQATGASLLLTSCASCQRHLKEAGERAAFGIEVKDLLEFLVGAHATTSVPAGVS